MTTAASARSSNGTAAAARGALEILLTDAAVGGRGRFLPARAAARTLAGLARRPRHEVPMLIVPPTINRFYVLDLAPGRSLVAAGALGHLATEGALGDVASLTLLVRALDNARAGTAAALAGREVAAAAVAESARKGYLDGRALAGVFAWLRPNDLIWGYVVNNYLMGRKPPAFDVLYLNQDTVRLAAGLHRDFIRIALENSLTHASAVEVLGSPVDLGAVTTDCYVVGGLNDHIVPWENAYRSALLLRGDVRFVLSTSGHIQALVVTGSHVGLIFNRDAYRAIAHALAQPEIR